MREKEPVICDELRKKGCTVRVCENWEVEAWLKTYIRKGVRTYFFPYRGKVVGVVAPVKSGVTAGYLADKQFEQLWVEVEEKTRPVKERN